MITGYFWISYEDYYVESVPYGINLVQKGKQDISDINVDIESNEFFYNGEEIRPKVIFSYNGEKGEYNKDYTVQYVNNIEKGTGKAIITGIGRYTGVVTRQFLIKGQSIDKALIELEQNEYTYDGKEKRPKVTVKLDGKILDSSNYTLEYINNINAGTASVRITAKGRYTGTAIKTFIINQKSINNTIIELDQYEYIYNGRERKPNVIIVDGVKYLSENKDYTIYYRNNKNAGVGIVEITGIGNYKGKKNLEFIIFKSQSIEIPRKISDKTYNGQKQKAEITIPNGASIVESKSTTEAINAGTYRVEFQIKDTSNYTWTDGTEGNKTITWKIEKAIPKYEIPQGIRIIEGKTLGDVKLPEGFSWELPLTTSVGQVGEKEFKSTYTPKDVANYKIVTGIKVKISVYEKANIEKARIELDQNKFVYDGKEKRPEVTVVLGNKLIENIDYTIIYKSNKNAGVGIVEITGIGNYKGKKDLEFTILRSPSIEIPRKIGDKTYNGQKQKVEITIPNGASIVERKSTTEAMNAGTYRVEIQLNDPSNYTWTDGTEGNKTITWKIEKAIPKYEIPQGIRIIEGKTLGDIKLPEGFSWDHSLTTSVGQVGEKEFKCTYTPKDVANYQIVTGIKLKINVLEKIKIQSQNYYITEEDGTKYLEKLKSGTTVAKLKENIESNGNLSIYDKDRVLITKNTEIIKTGMIIKVKTELEEIEIIAVVSGDINGDGNIRASDLSILKRTIIGKNKLEGAYYKAADLNDDKQIKASDLSKLKRLIIGL